MRDLSASLGVSTGSFYWHFQNRSDFLESLLHYWTATYTTSFIRQLDQAPLDARTKLITVAEGVVKENFGRYDIPIRAWAAHDSKIAVLVKKVDRARLAFVRRQFTELGFEGDDLEMRTRTFMTYYSVELAILARQSKRQRLAEVRPRVELLCRA